MILSNIITALTVFGGTALVFKRKNLVKAYKAFIGIDAQPILTETKVRSMISAQLKEPMADMLQLIKNIESKPVITPIEVNTPVQTELPLEQPIEASTEVSGLKRKRSKRK